MADRTSSEIKELVHEAREGLQKLDTIEDFWHRVEAGAYDYASKVPKDLGDAVVVKRRGVTEQAALMESVISWPLRVSVDLAKEGPKAESEADDIETFLAHCLLRGDPSDTGKSRLRYDMVHSRFGAMWVAVVPKNRPPRNKGESEKAYQIRVDQWEQQYWRWRFETLNPRTVGFLERNGLVTMAVVEEEIGVIDLASYYENEKDQHPLELLQEKLPNLRAMDGTSPEDGENWLKSKVKRCIVDDGGRIYHYIEQPNSTDGQEYREATESFPNTLGRPSLIVFHGTYRPHAPPEERHEAMMAPMVEIEHRLTMFESIAMTVAGNPRFAEEMPPDISAQLLNLIASGVDAKTFASASLDAKDEQGRRVVTALKGTLKDASTKLGPEFQLAYDAALKQWDDARQSLMMLNPAPDTIEQGTAASIYAAIEAGMRRFEKQQSTIVGGYTAALNMIAHDIVYGQNPHLNTSGPDAYLDKAIEFRTVGKELRRTGRAVEAGKKMTISPKVFAQFPEPGRINVEIVAASQAQRAAAVQLALEMEQRGFATPADVLEASGEEDVSGKLIELAAWQNAKLLSPGYTKMAMIDAIRRLAIREGRDEAMLQMLFTPEFGGGGGGGPPKTVSGSSYSAPNTPMPGRLA